MTSMDVRKVGRLKRKKRIRKKIYGTAEKPRLCVFRSAKHIYAQIIDDTEANTIVAASTLDKELLEHSDFNETKDGIGIKTARAGLVGKIVAERAIEKGIKKIVFDRNGFLYHGRVKAVSDGARKAGLRF